MKNQPNHSYSDIYRTKDLAEAAILMVKERKLSGVDREGKICWFNFEGLRVCESLVKIFWFDTCLVDARTYYQAMGTLKKYIFSE